MICCSRIHLAHFGKQVVVMCNCGRLSWLSGIITVKRGYIFFMEVLDLKSLDICVKFAIRAGEMFGR